MINVVGKFCINNDAVERIADFKIIIIDETEQLIEATTERKVSGSVFTGKALLDIENDVYETELDAFKALVEQLEAGLEWAERHVRQLEGGDG